MAYSLTWNAGAYDFSEEVERLSWDDPTIIPVEFVPRRHGAIVTEEPVLGARTISLAGKIVLGTAAATRARVNVLAKALNAVTNKQLRFESTRQITCYKKDGSWDFAPGTGMLVAVYELTFFAADPFWYDVSQSSTDQVTSYNPTAWAHTNSGDAFIYPVVTVIADQGGPVAGFTLTNSTTGKSFAYAGTVAAGTSCVVDMANFTVVNNGTADLANGSGTWLWLDSGSNTLSFAGTACTVRIAYYPRYYAPRWD